MYDKYKSYTGAFLIAGLPPMIFGILLTTTRCVRKRSVEMDLEDKDLNEPKLLDPIPESYSKEGKHSTIIPTAERTLLLSKKTQTHPTHVLGVFGCFVS